MIRDPRTNPQPGDEIRGRGGQLRRVNRRDGDILWCQDGSIRYKTTVQRWREWSRRAQNNPEIPRKASAIRELIRSPEIPCAIPMISSRVGF